MDALNKMKRTLHALCSFLPVAALAVVSGCSADVEPDKDDPGQLHQDSQRIERGCPEVGCIDRVRISLTGLAARFSGSLPLTVKACTGAGDATCVTATVKAQAGQPATCEAHDDGSVRCSVDPDGTLLVHWFQPPTASDVARGKIDVHLTVTDAARKVLFDQTTTGTIELYSPNGPSCPPTCHHVSLTLAP